MLSKKNLILLLLLLFLIACTRGILQSSVFVRLFTSNVAAPVANDEWEKVMAEPEVYVEVILDVSGSMWGQIKGVSKFINSRKVLEVVLKDLPDHVRLGLRTFGGTKESHLVINVGTDNRQEMINIIEKLRPSGKSPIGYALEQAGQDLGSFEAKKYIILISDGIDTGEINPSAKSKELYANGIITHVVYVQDGQGEGSQVLKEIAKVGGGHFFTFNEKDLVVPTLTVPQ